MDDERGDQQAFERFVDQHPSLVACDAPLARHTSLRVGGPARYLLESEDGGLVGLALAAAKRAGLSVLALGGGSNLLVAEGGFDGLVVKYSGNSYAVDERGGPNGVVTAAAGLAVANLARRLARAGWAGLEWASNVPGTIGGAAVNNAGAFGGCMANDLIGLELLDAAGRRSDLANADLEYAYRSSCLKRGEIGGVVVTAVRCRVRRDDPTAALARIAEYQRLRTASQPRQLSAGSVFANPADDFAGRLIEVAGLKGRRVGGAEVSAHHANFIVNPGGATARDVYTLIRLTQETVWQRSRIWLRPEIQLVGTWSSQQLATVLEPPAGAAGEVA
ncbi:MAG: UDP-N-acetylmuramate dehydrogenase [Chloroflexi bacterium]|nr:UDP-N-acetylmuramate dehydrogenase [Chloroflexota bacterium]